MKPTSADSVWSRLAPLVILFAVNLILRLLLISKGPYHADCLLLAVSAEQSLAEGKLHYLQLTGLPLTVILAAVFTGFFHWIQAGDCVAAVNFMNVFLGAVSVPLFYLLVKELFGSAKTAWLAAAMMTINPLFLALSVFGNSHIAAVLFGLGGLVWLFRYDRTDTPGALIAAAILFGLMGACRLQELAFVLPPVSLICLLKPRAGGWRREAVRWVVFAAVTAAVTALFYLPLLSQAGQAADGPDRSADIWKYIVGENKFDPQRFKVIALWVLSTLSQLGAIGAGCGLLLLTKQRPRTTAALAALVICPAVLYGIFWHIAPRYYLLSSLMLTIPAAYFFATFWQDRRWIHYPLMALLMFTLIMNARFAFQIVNFRHVHTLLTDFFVWVGESTEPGALIIERDHSLFIKRYSRREPMGPPGSLYSIDSDQMRGFRAHIDGLLAQQVPVYITDTALAAYPKRLGFREFMSERFRLEPVGNRPVENWYVGVLRHYVFSNTLYRVHARTGP
ncbi:MAG: glycosyltransferase family 39 protein [Candidatus Omnitrophica bacterium]|nr:glycosyltransferase family 39 protein [Candidatus Omnitrophota bacterium]